MTTGRSGLPRSDYFKLVEAGDGIWAAIASEFLNAVGNMTIVDMGGRALIVDSSASARVAAELRDAARRLTGCEAAWLVNTHFHDDHTGGNEVFAATATIAATERTRELVEAGALETPDRIAEQKAQLEALPGGDDPELVTRRKDAEAYLDWLLRLRVVAPSATITDRLTLYGERRRAELVAIGTAHTSGDLIVHLPDDRIVATGDAVLVKSHAYAGDGNVLSWLEALPRIRALEPHVVIPGHGVVGHASDIDEMAAYLGELIALGRGALFDGSGPAASIVVPEIPERFRGWGWAEGWPGAVEAAVAQVAAAQS